MLSVPLPLLAGLIFVFALHHSLKGVEVPGSRRYFTAFLAFYALQGVVVGLHFGYGLKLLAPVQPITAAVMPPLAYLAFRALSAEPPARSWRHLAGPIAVGLCVAMSGVLVDVMLLVIFCCYGVALWRLSRSGGPDIMAEAALQRMAPARRAARLTAGLMLFFAASDAFVAIYAGYYGPGDVPLAVTISNLAAIACIAIYWWLPVPSQPRPERTGQSRPPSKEEAAIVEHVAAALDRGALYRDENLSLAKLARRSGVAPRELSAAINRATGLNVSQFVNKRRIEEACRLLEETDQSATAIMLEVGFSTKSNFNREFRRITGKSPRQWRSDGRRKGQSVNNGLDLSGSRQQLGNVQR